MVCSEDLGGLWCVLWLFVEVCGGLWCLLPPVIGFIIFMVLKVNSVILVPLRCSVHDPIRTPPLLISILGQYAIK